MAAPISSSSEVRMHTVHRPDDADTLMLGAACLLVLILLVRACA